MTKGTILRRAAFALTLLLPAPGLRAEPESEPDWSDWDLDERIAAVGGRKLRLLPDGAPADAHVHENRIRIRRESLAEGWVWLDQCHERLDAVPALEVAFKTGRVRNLRIASAERIGLARVEGDRVRLEDIEAGARLCLLAETRALRDLGNGYYRLRNGPYMRRFLDGYYPLRVQLHIEYPPEVLDFVRAQPPAQPGVDVRSEPGRLRLDVSFDGELYTCMDFRTEDAKGHGPPDSACSDD